MKNKFISMGIKRSLTYMIKRSNSDDSSLVLLGYYHYKDANAPSQGNTTEYMGETPPNKYIEWLINISFSDYFNVTTYSSEKYGSSSIYRYTPPSPVTQGEERFRDCSSFIWDIMNMCGFIVTNDVWYTGSAYDYLLPYQIDALDRQCGDLILYWPSSGGVPVGGGSSHMMLYIGNDWYIDTTGGKLTACAQRNSYNLDSGLCRFYRIPPELYPIW